MNLLIKTHQYYLDNKVHQAYLVHPYNIVIKIKMGLIIKIIQAAIQMIKFLIKIHNLFKINHKIILNRNLKTVLFS